MPLVIVLLPFVADAFDRKQRASSVICPTSPLSSTVATVSSAAAVASLHRLATSTCHTLILMTSHQRDRSTQVKPVMCYSVDEQLLGLPCFLGSAVSDFALFAARDPLPRSTVEALNQISVVRPLVAARFLREKFRVWTRLPIGGPKHDSRGRAFPLEYFR